MSAKPPFFQNIIIGVGPAGIMAAMQIHTATVLLIDKQKPLWTLLATGGGRCNLTHAVTNNQELLQYYPRGTKFLHSVFQRFTVADTLAFFRQLSIETYTQADQRIFPVSNSAATVRHSLLDTVATMTNLQFCTAEVQSIEIQQNLFTVITTKGNYQTKHLLLSTGGNRLHPLYSGYQLATTLGHHLTPLRPSLCGLILQEKFLTQLSGVSLKQITATTTHTATQNITGDLLFTHQGISGPLAYTLSAYHAYDDLSNNHPLEIMLNLTSQTAEQLQQQFFKMPNKSLMAFLNLWLPQSLSKILLQQLQLSPTNLCGNLPKKNRQQLLHLLENFPLHIIGRSSQGEIVTAGGICLDEIQQQTLQSKLVPGLYFAGEILDIDGLTGGFNLQMCWSTGYLAGQALNQDNH